VAEVSTIASLATAGGTLILAVATFASTRSANRAARVSEQALKAGLRPVLFNARPQDPAQKVGFADDHWLLLRDGLVAVQERQERLYLSIPLRNVGTGLAVLHGWHLWPQRADDPPPPPEDFRRLTRDLYVPAGDVSLLAGGPARPRRSAVSAGPRVDRRAPLDERRHPLRRSRGRPAYDHALLPVGALAY
jgi:hypothetical protein